ncbi:MAG: SNF2-related protein [Acidobacteriota bacterium]|nr:SNF2-related protein [Acidobacteriota bacterium]
MTEPNEQNARPRKRRRRRGRARPDEGPVPLLKRSFSHFDESDRDRGQGYFEDGRVELEIDGVRACARVQGTDKESYAVGVDWSQVAERRALHAFCECPRFIGGKACKHLWATLLALAEHGPDSYPPGRNRVGLRKDRAGAWPELGVEETAANAPVVRRRTSRSRRGRRNARTGADRGGAWRTQLAALGETKSEHVGHEQVEEARLLINTSASLGSPGMVIDIFEQRDDDNGALKVRRARLDPGALEDILQPSATGDDRRLTVITTLSEEKSGARARSGRGRARQGAGRGGDLRRFRLPPQIYESVIPSLCDRGVLGWWDGRPRGDRNLLNWDDGDPWQLVLRLEGAEGTMSLQGRLERAEERLPLTAPLLILPFRRNTNGVSGLALVVFQDSIARLEVRQERDLAWIERLREVGEIVIPNEDLGEALTALLEIPDLPEIETTDETKLSQEEGVLEPHLMLEADPIGIGPDPPLLARLSFGYGEVEISADDPRPTIIDGVQGKFLRRDLDGEHAALVRLLENGVRPVSSGRGHELEVPTDQLPMVAEPLLAEGWSVELRGVSLRSASPGSMRVETGLDWFEVQGGAEFDGNPVELKEILQAVASGSRFVELEDGSQGLLPQSWMETYQSLSKLSQEGDDESLCFLPSQALLVDAQLAVLPGIDVDKKFAELRDKLRSLGSITAKKEPRGFKGTLRDYQRDGLGWLEFLREFSLGGVLADDMGLGKTVQVLALLRANRTPARTTGLPSLVVAPRSLLYNWVEEAERFTPTLKFEEYRGPGREKLRKKLAKIDVLVTTYGTLRRDIDWLSTVEFDTVILDEAQAIKNQDSQSAKASRLLRARNRLALTGTPIENHLGELGSLFEFLNPGLLGKLPRLGALRGARTASKEELTLIAQGTRPFILRRKKEDVLKDLPPKTEQVLYCSLRPEQRELYDKLRAGYQASLLNEVDLEGVTGFSMQVLEALLRLRQVACHPGLVNTEWEQAGSAKMEALFEQVAEVLEEGHKLLIFSQFTKLLAYVRTHFDDSDIPYAYLDGKTRDRKEVVDRFQTDDDCNVFLISLKAGGLGLNLTAAEYVFLLDPWWNPAVEAQAIDRAHRIGQTQPVFSYRLIARDTVEERMVELQQSKRELADSVLEGDAIPLRDLTADDLRKLFS